MDLCLALEAPPREVAAQPRFTERNDTLAWTSEAIRSLQRDGFAVIKLMPTEAAAVHEMLDAAQQAFEDSVEMRALRISDEQLDNLDSRDGYVCDRVREWLELHHFGSHPFGKLEDHPKACRFLETALTFASICEARCTQALAALATAIGGGGAAQLRALVDGAERARAEVRPRETISPMVRVYKYHGVLNERDGDPHYDMGLLTLIPKSSSPGLEIQPKGSAEWVPIETMMGADEAILFGGMTLARICTSAGVHALHHRILTHGRVRISAPYFQRAATHVFLAASPKHPEEMVGQYNHRLRQCDNHQLCADGSVQFCKSRRRYSPPAERPHADRSLADCSSAHRSSGTRPSRRNGHGDGYGNGYGNGRAHRSIDRWSSPRAERHTDWQMDRCADRHAERRSDRHGSGWYTLSDSRSVDGRHGGRCADDHNWRSCAASSSWESSPRRSPMEAAQRDETISRPEAYPSSSHTWDNTWDAGSEEGTSEAPSEGARH